MSLEEAATKVKISKKSLDDYLMQLRSAKKFNFDFETNKNQKVGVIRKFVKKMKEEERRQKNAAKEANTESAFRSKKNRKLTIKSTQNDPLRPTLR